MLTVGYVSWHSK